MVLDFCVHGVFLLPMLAFEVEVCSCKTTLPPKFLSWIDDYMVGLQLLILRVSFEVCSCKTIFSYRNSVANS